MADTNNNATVEVPEDGVVTVDISDSPDLANVGKETTDAVTQETAAAATTTEEPKPEKKKPLPRVRLAEDAAKAAADEATATITQAIKTAEDAADPKVRLRLMIEHIWCREHGIAWTLIDTSEFSKEMLSNLRFMRAWFRNHYEPDLNSVERFSQQFQLSYGTNIPLNELIQRAAKPLRLAEDVAKDIFRY